MMRREEDLGDVSHDDAVTAIGWTAPRLAFSLAELYLRASFKMHQFFFSPALPKTYESNREQAARRAHRDATGSSRRLGHRNSIKTV